MGAPIVVQPRQNPWQGMLMQMYMTKFAHNLKVKQDELDLKKATLIRDEERDFEKQKTLASEKRGTERTIATEERAAGRPVYKPGQLLDFKVGDKNIQHKYEGGKWVPTGITSPRYKPAGVTVNLKQSTGAERENLAAGEAALSTLDNLKGLYDEAFVGPIAGRVGKVKDVFGGNPEKQSNFNAATHAFKNQIIKEITGAQMSEVEAKRIMKQIPDVNDPPKVWGAKWKQSRRNISVLRKKRLEVMRKSGVLTPKDDNSYDFEYVPGKGLVPAGGN